MSSLPFEKHHNFCLGFIVPALVIPLFGVVSCSGDSSSKGSGDDDLKCGKSLDCPPDWICDTDIGYCVPGECAPDVPCRDGKVCEEGKCVQACTDDSGCPPASKCFPPDGRCYGGDSCRSDSDCDAPEGSHNRVTCNTSQKICQARFTPCTQDNGWEICKEDEYCHATGWCVPVPHPCIPEACRPGTHCNQATGDCEDNPDCEEGFEPDPVDGTCRLGLCTSDGDCRSDEWCDLLNTGMCRGKCSDDKACLQGEVCNRSTGRCAPKSGCEQGEECTNGKCECNEGLLCWSNPDLKDGREYCLKSCDPVGGVITCPTGTKCAPLADETGKYDPHRGACLEKLQGNKVNEECTEQSVCERDLLCVDGFCRRPCNQDSPACGSDEDCLDPNGIGISLCIPEPTCASDLECSPPDSICDLSSYPGRCVHGCSQAGCNAGWTCNQDTGRCDPDKSCFEDDDCGVPNYVCIEDKCSASCIFRGCRLPLICNHTTGRCGHGCSVDLDCGPPDMICEQGECTTGCEATGCPALETCDKSTGRCSKASCDSDQDCDPPNTICDYNATRVCVPGCIGVGCKEQNQVCDVHSGRCVQACVRDDDCNPPKEICITGTCRKGCTLQDGLECPDGTECDPVTGRCKPTLCSRDSDCDPPYFICDYSTSLCVHGCVTNGCGPGESCNQTTGRCE